MGRREKRSKKTERALAALELVDCGAYTIGTPEWGTIVDFPEYLKIDRVSSHALMDFDKSPRLYKRKRDGLIPRFKSDAYSFGTAAHVYILEGSEEFTKQYHVGEGPINEKTGKSFGTTSAKYLDWANGLGKPVVSDSDYAKIIEMHQAIQQNEKASSILSEGIPELTIMTELGSHKVKQRLDWYSPEAILDLKTTKSIETFEEDFWKYRYDIQAGMCGLIMRSLTGTVLPYYILATQKSEPYSCKLYWVCDDTMYNAMSRVESLMFRLEGCSLDDRWPYGTELEGVL